MSYLFKCGIMNAISYLILLERCLSLSTYQAEWLGKVHHHQPTASVQMLAMALEQHSFHAVPRLLTLKTMLFQRHRQHLY